jgi:predicted nucleic acid-binding protein
VTPRVVLDTNVLVAAAYAPASASRAIVEACLDGELEAIMSEETVREHRYILGRAVRSRAYHSAYLLVVNLVLSVFGRTVCGNDGARPKKASALHPLASLGRAQSVESSAKFVRITRNVDHPPTC